MMGWFPFLVQPLPSTTDTMTNRSKEVAAANGTTTTMNGDTKKPKDAPKPQAPGSGFLYQSAVNVFISFVIFSFLMDTAPINELYGILPVSTHALLDQTSEFRELAVHSYLDPYILSPLGVYTGVWNLFCVAPDEINQFEGVINLGNGTSVYWHSPDWAEKTWYEKKRFQRPMTFYEYLGDGPVVGLYDTFTRQIAAPYTDVMSVELYHHQWVPPPPLENAGFWDVARHASDDDYKLTVKELYTLNLCDNTDDRCFEWAEEGSCFAHEHYKIMMERCRRVCGYCDETDDIVVGSRIKLYWPVDRFFYDATVREITSDQKRFYVEYDIHEGTDQFEWVTKFQMRERFFFFTRDPTAYTNDGMELNYVDTAETEPMAVDEQARPDTGFDMDQTIPVADANGETNDEL